MPSRYFWRGNDVLEVDVASAWPHNVQGLFCVDCEQKDPDLKYGTYLPAWLHIPFEDFPPEFKLHLLVLGVT